MSRKPKEPEQEIEVKNKPKKETFASRWFKENAVNNTDDLKIICDITARSVSEQFSIEVKSTNTEVFAVVFYGTFMKILEFLRGQQKKYNNFTVEICNSINIGYTNSDDDFDEKKGNFMPVLEYIGINRNIIDGSYSIDEDKTTENLLRWKQLNIKKNIECCQSIQENAYQYLKKEFRTDLRTSEAVIPIFCIFMDNITNVLKQKFQELYETDISEVSINVLGLFDVFYSYDEEDHQEVIDFIPNITMKLALKNDEIASRE